MTIFPSEILIYLENYLAVEPEGAEIVQVNFLFTWENDEFTLGNKGISAEGGGVFPSVFHFPKYIYLGNSLGNVHVISKLLKVKKYD